MMKKPTDYVYPTAPQLRALGLIDVEGRPSITWGEFGVSRATVRALHKKGYTDAEGRITELGKELRERLGR